MNNDTLLIKQKNFQKIHALFFQYPVISKPRIVQLLGLSTPTVSTHITELLNQKLIQPSSSMQSQNGRPAIGYSLVPDAKVAFGVEIKFNQVRCAVVDLVGHATNIQEFPLPCSEGDGNRRRIFPDVRSPPAPCDRKACPPSGSGSCF